MKPGPERTLTLFTRRDCHLCHVAEEVLVRLRASHPFALEVVDLDEAGSPEQRATYDLEVPVVELDGRKVFKYRIDEARLVRLLEAT